MLLRRLTSCFVAPLMVLLTSSIAVAAKKTTVIISAGVPRGGLGDIAPNLLVAMRLAQRQDTEVTLWVTPSNETEFKTLIGMSELPQNYKGVRIFYTPEHDSTKTPSMDIGVVVADSLIGNPPLNCKLQLSFNAFGYDDGSEGRLDARLRKLGHSVFRFNAGPAAQSLYYYPEEKQNLSLKELLSRVKAPANNPYFTYAHFAEVATLRAYLAGLAKSVGPEKRITVLTGNLSIAEHGGSAISIPPTVDLVRSPHSLDLAYAAIYHSSLPALVTGNSSVSFAIQNRKPAFVEVMSWDQPFASRLQEAIPFSGWPQWILLDSAKREHFSDQVARLTGDVEEQKRFSEALTKANGWSLPDRVSEVVTLYREGKLNGDDAARLEALRKQPDGGCDFSVLAR